MAVTCGGCEGIPVAHDIPCTGNGLKAGTGTPIWAFIPWQGRFVGSRLQWPKRHASLREPSLEPHHAAAHPALLAAGLVATPAPADTLRVQIRHADIQLFAAAFEACDADKAAAMTTDDTEFFHDKDGKSASSREDFRHSVANLCSSACEGGWQLRRELVESSLQVFPLHDERALEIGDHRFYERGNDGVERWTGQARFIQVWRRVDGHWLAERVISYDHRPAD